MTNDDRRAMDSEWRRGVDEKLRDGGVKFDALAASLDTNTGLTLRVQKIVEEQGRRLDQHVEDTGNFRAEALNKLQNIELRFERLDPLERGVAVMGKIGDAGAFVATWSRRFMVWVAPFVAVIGAIIAWFHFGQGGK